MFVCAYSPRHVHSSKTVCRDPDDDPVRATAVGAGATTIVTGDDDLLVLKSYSGIEICSPRRFLEQLDSESLDNTMHPRVAKPLTRQQETEPALAC